MTADEFATELKIALSASRIWLDKFGESAKGSVSWEFACAFAEDYAAQALRHAERRHVAELVEALEQFAQCDLNESNCDSLETATQRIRNIAKLALRRFKEGL